MPPQRRHRSNSGLFTDEQGGTTTVRPLKERHVFILGAGADVGFGIPPMATLLRQLAAFAKSDGEPIHKYLRSQLKGMQFTFDAYAGDQSNDMLRQLLSSDNQQLIEILRTTAFHLRADDRAAPMAPLLERLSTIGENNQLPGEVATALAVFGGSNEDVSGGEAIIDPGKHALTRTATQALRQAFLLALDIQDGYSDEQRERVQYFVDATSNIEELLSLHFARYILGEVREQKKFLYIIWMLWAFLRFKSTQRPTAKASIYDQFPSLSGKIITFNYTDFFQARTLRDVCYFHGRLSEYLQLDTRAVVRDTPLLTGATTPQGIVRFLESVRLDLTKPQMIDVPSIVPPIAFKPVTSREQLLTWAAADQLIQEASTAVVVGYSFAMADEHFNDLLRHANPDLKVVVVNPDLEVASYQASRVLGVDTTTFTSESRGGVEVRRSGRLVCAKAYAEQVSEEFLAGLG